MRKKDLALGGQGQKLVHCFAYLFGIPVKRLSRCILVYIFPCLLIGGYGLSEAASLPSVEHAGVQINVRSFDIAEHGMRQANLAQEGFSDPLSNVNPLLAPISAKGQMVAEIQADKETEQRTRSDNQGFGGCATDEVGQYSDAHLLMVILIAFVLPLLLGVMVGYVGGGAVFEWLVVAFAVLLSPIGWLVYRKFSILLWPWCGYGPYEKCNGERLKFKYFLFIE